MTKDEYDLHLLWMKDWHNKEYTIPWTPSVVQLEPATTPPVLDMKMTLPKETMEQWFDRQVPAKQTMNESSDSNEKQVGGRHYKRCAIQPWDYTIANDLDYFQGSIVKYVTRWKDKGGVEDLHKAKHFLDKYIETMEQKFKTMKERPDGQEADKKA